MRIPPPSVRPLTHAALVPVAAPAPLEQLARGVPELRSVLGPKGMVPVEAVPREQGRVVWFNWALAEQLGLELPSDRRMTPEFEAKLLAQLNLEILPAGEDSRGRPVVTGWADFYGGSGLGHNRGSGRAAFFGDLNAKGIGAVREMLSDLTPYDHRHGGMSLTEGAVEAILGEVNQNLFSRGSTRVLAVLDRGDHITWSDGGVERRGLAFRHGKQVRPAHLMAGPNKGQELDILLRALEQAGDLVRTPRGQIDLAASMERLAEAHARVAAEQYRYRILHGALSPSNMEVDATFLDLGTQTAQPRTAPVRVLEYSPSREYSFDSEKSRRVDHLNAMYTLARTGLRGRADVVDRMSTNLGRHFLLAYERELQVQLAGAAGLSPDVARALDGKLASRFSRALTAIGAEVNRQEDLGMDKKVVSHAGVADIFGALAAVPKTFFLHPEQDLRTSFTEALALVGAKSPGQAERMQGLIEELATAYRDLLDAARKVHRSRGGTDFGFERTVIHRAAFENRPLDGLYRSQLRQALIEATEAYEGSGDADRFQRTLDRIIAHGLRDVDALCRLGAERALADGSVLTQARTVRGVDYGVVLPEGGAPSVRVALPVEPLDGGRVRLPTLDGAELSAEQVGALVYQHTIDGWATQGFAKAERQGEEIVFRVPSFPSQTAVLEGVFHVERGDFWLKDRAGNFEGYVFSVPDEDRR